MKFIDFVERQDRIRVKDHDIDISQIESVYGQAHLAVRIVQMYEQATGKNFLQDITTVADLASGAYGLYNSQETKQLLPPEVRQQQMIFYGKVSDKQIPAKVLSKYLSKEQLSKVKNQGTIHVNVRRIMKQFPGDIKRILLEIASTIIHECRHEIERRETGMTSEQGPVAEEHAFLRWAENNWSKIYQNVNNQI